jgi:hypothetical protein
MTRCLLALLLAVAPLSLGCESKPKEPVVEETPVVEEKGGVEINAPGVKVDVGGGKGVEVEAPGVEVDTKPEN